MIISIKYNVGGRAYTYESDIDVTVGQELIVPTVNGNMLAIVDAINVPAPEGIELKHITGKETIEEVESDFDFKVIEERLPVVKINFDELKSNLTESLKQYKGLIVTEDNYKTCKQKQKELARLRKTVDEYRLKKKKELTAPIKAFEDSCKELMALIEDTEKPILELTTVFDNKIKASKIEFAKKIIAEQIVEKELIEQFAADLIVKDEYSNVSSTENTIRRDIVEYAELLVIRQDQFNDKCKYIENQVTEENKTLTTKLSMDSYIQMAFSNDDSMATIQKVKEDAARIRQMEQAVIAEQERKAEEKKQAKEFIVEVIKEEPVEEVIPEEQEMIIEDEPLFTKAKLVNDDIYFANIRIAGSKSDVDFVKQFMESNEISYDLINEGTL